MAIGWPAAALAQEAPPAEAQPPSRAAGADFYYSADADDTEVIRAGVNLDVRYRGPDEYLGIRLENAWFSPQGLPTTSDQRIYLRAADTLGGWKWKANVGTDGDTVLGSVSIHNEARVRQEYFIERDKIETPQGISRGIFYTYAGAAVDLPIDDRNTATLLVGLQDFTGDNLRKQVRASFVHVVKPDWGLSAQLRTRYFHNSRPREFDYYSPEWYVEALPVIQLRRFSGGWQYLAALGWGAQRDSDSDWRQSRYANARITSPASSDGWSVTGTLTYSSTPITDSPTYDYFQISLGLTRAF